jgi:hypothetical protein
MRALTAHLLVDPIMRPADMTTNDQQNTVNTGLSQMLERQFGVKVPAARLESARTIGQLQDIVLSLLFTLGKAIDERAVQTRVCKVAMVNYRMPFRRAAYNFLCLKCHQRLGVEGVRLGNQRWAGFLDNFRLQNPGCLVSFVRDVDAVCPRCGCEYTYHSEDASLRLRGGHGLACDLNDAGLRQGGVEHRRRHPPMRPARLGHERGPLQPRNETPHPPVAGEDVCKEHLRSPRTARPYFPQFPTLGC